MFVLLFAQRLMPSLLLVSVLRREFFALLVLVRLRSAQH
jgi:hypothetical protein